jgi:AcrR family transcriptional regulator
MQTENKLKRQVQIETTAYAVLREKGYTGTSMLSISKRAKASNETLYRWYGDKLGLFKSLIEQNAHDTKELLEEHLSGDEEPINTLRTLGPVLLSLLVGERAISLNQAAAADQSGELGVALSEIGRETIAPLITQILINARTAGALDFTNAEDTTELYISLLVGDLQIRRAIGRMTEPDAYYIGKRAGIAFANFINLVGVKNG